MPDRQKLQPVDELIREALAGAAPKHARYQPCEHCGQAFDRLDPMLAAYHSVAEHKPMPDGAL